MIRDAGNEQPPKNAPVLPIRGRGTPQISRWFLFLQPLPHWDACNDEINRSRLVIRHLFIYFEFPTLHGSGNHAGCNQKTITHYHNHCLDKLEAGGENMFISDLCFWNQP